MEVWKETKTEYYTQALKNRNIHGSFSSARKRTVTVWCARIDGKVVKGFSTKKSALAATEK